MIDEEAFEFIITIANVVANNELNVLLFIASSHIYVYLMILRKRFLSNSSGIDCEINDLCIDDNYDLVSDRSFLEYFMNKRHLLDFKLNFRIIGQLKFT